MVAGERYRQHGDQQANAARMVGHACPDLCQLAI
jgi:hypothetical protein